MTATQQAGKDAARKWAQMRRTVFIFAVITPALIALVLLRGHLIIGVISAVALILIPLPAKLLMMLGDHLFITKTLERLYL
jgi:hypothetical protein